MAYNIYLQLIAAAGVPLANADDIGYNRDSINTSKFGGNTVGKKLKDIEDALEKVGQSSGNDSTLKSVTYNELVVLRNENNLTPGVSYRITDYVTTVAGLDLVKSVNHPFDIIVTAMSSNELSEDAKAIQHEGDEYFANCTLSAWELKYCLDNDTERFTWADTEHGKGVVWYMKDESGNSAYYDFKGVQVRESATSNDWYYTFSVYYTDTQEDFSVAKYNYNGKGCIDNTIDIQHVQDAYNKVTINYNTIIADARSGNGVVNIDNYYWRSVYNHIGKCCSNIKVNKSCTNVKFGNYCNNITFNTASNISFGEQNQYIYFNNMDDTVFGTFISNFKFVKEDGSYANVASSIIETNYNSGNYISIKSAHTIKNLHIKAGVANGKTQTIEINKCGNYTTTIERSASTNEVIVSKSGDIHLQTESIIYSVLKSLRDNSQLTPGKKYRITDYVTTTTQYNTQSAKHRFDVIVTALTNNTLSEDAKACLHDGDTYFQYSNLSAWEIKYCLDNDKYRFYWADDSEQTIIDSSNVNINLQLLNDNKFINAIYPDYYIYVDNQQLDISEYESKGDFFVEFGRETSPDGLENQLCIYKTTEEYEEEGADYPDKFFYCGKEEIDGVIYDKWQKSELGSWFTGLNDFSNPSMLYVLTEQITVGDISYSRSGKGVIYYMKDEYNNECPYDFKNIMFKINTPNFLEDFYYTFSLLTDYKINEMSLIGKYLSNIIKESYEESSLILNHNVFISTNEGYVLNYIVNRGLSNVTIELLDYDYHDRIYETRVARNSSGEIKIYCEADLIL